MLLSNSEKEVIRQGCLEDCRIDARACQESRNYTIHTGPLVLAHGSAALQDHGNHILCSVKAEIVKPSEIHPNEGSIEFHVESLAPKTTSNDELQGLLTQLVVLPVLKDLCIVEGQYAWRLHVDLYLLQTSGSLVQIAASVLQAALSNTLLPSIQHHTKNDDLTVESDITKASSVSAVALRVVTVTVMRCGTSFCLLLDATAEEEACSFAQVHVGVMDQSITALQTVGRSSLPYSLLPKITELAIQGAQLQNVTVKEGNVGLS